MCSGQQQPRRFVGGGWVGVWWSGQARTLHRLHVLRLHVDALDRQLAALLVHRDHLARLACAAERSGARQQRRVTEVVAEVMVLWRAQRGGVPPGAGFAQAVPWSHDRPCSGESSAAGRPRQKHGCKSHDTSETESALSKALGVAAALRGASSVVGAASSLCKPRPTGRCVLAGQHNRLRPYKPARPWNRP